MNAIAVAQDSPEAVNTGGVESRRVVDCTNCGWALMVVDDCADECPNCRSTGCLSARAGHDGATPQAEYVIRELISHDDVAKSVAAAIVRHSLLPSDLRPDHLTARLVRWYEPVWLHDLHVRARWTAQGGWKRPLVTTADQLRDGAWLTEPIIANEIVWDDLAGELDRQYRNVVARALTTPTLAEARDVTKFEWEQAPWSAEMTAGRPWRVPEVPKEEAALAALEPARALAALECRTASGADLIRDFDWVPETPVSKATLLLVPAWSTYYVDEAGKRHVWHISALTAQINGKIVRSHRAVRALATVGAVCAALVVATGFTIPSAQDNVVLKYILWIAAIVGAVVSMQLVTSGSEADADPAGEAR